MIEELLDDKIMSLFKQTINNEGEINNGGIDDIDELEYIIKKGKKVFCRIKNNPHSGTGIFCKLPDPENEDKYLTILLTCYHVFPGKFNINNLTKLIYSINKNEYELSLFNRRIWFNEKENLDYICIEIFKKDNIEDFLNINSEFIDKNFDLNQFKKEKIKIFGYYQDDSLKCDKGIILNYKENFLVYNVNTYSGFSGGPILNKHHNLIGIHKGYIETKVKINTGIVLKSIYNDMTNKKPFRKINDIININSNNQRKKKYIYIIIGFITLFAIGFIVFLVMKGCKGGKINQNEKEKEKENEKEIENEINGQNIEEKKKEEKEIKKKEYVFKYEYFNYSGKERTFIYTINEPGDYKFCVYGAKAIKGGRGGKKCGSYSFSKKTYLTLEFGSQD